MATDANGNKVRLSKPVATATTKSIEEYRDAHLKGGDKFELANEVVRLRKLLGKKAEPEATDKK